MRNLSFLIPLVMAVCRGLTAEPDASAKLQQAYDRLVSVKLFGFGDVVEFGRLIGEDGGTTSQGEQCLRTLAASTNGLPWLKAALTNSTHAAQLYALCGIRHLAPEQFDSFAATYSTNHYISALSPFLAKSNLVAKIKSGAYEDFFVAKKKDQ